MTHFCCALVALHTCAMFPTPTATHTRSVIKSEALDKQSAAIDALLAPMTKPGGPGAAVIVVRNGRILHSKGYGLANRKSKTPFRPNTPSLIGSVSKQFTAMAIMQLAERGQLNYDDPVSKFFPDFPAYAAKVTVRNLLHQTSGTPLFDELTHEVGRIDASTEPAAMLTVLARQRSPRFAPGEKFEYNNGNYVLLSHIVERVSGKSYGQFMDENIFKPLGMNDTFVSVDTRRLAESPRAIGYFKEWYGLKISESLDLLRLYNGAGSLFSTVEDMAKWDQALYGGKLVSHASIELATTRGKLKDGRDTHYGFGWEVYQHKGVKYTIHPGGWCGFKAFILRFPAQHFSVIALSNSDQFDIAGLPMAITRIYLHDEIAVPQTIVNFD